MARERRPSIAQIGQVRDDGDTITITGWGIGLCVSGCGCHRHPMTGKLTIAEDHGTGDLGLVSYATGCTCCAPWSADELVAILDFRQVLAAVPVREPLGG